MSASSSPLPVCTAPGCADPEFVLKNAKEDPNAVKRDSTFYSDHVVFQVENQLYKVPKRKFEQDSEVFRNMFGLPRVANSVVAEGLTDEHPLVLEGIRAEDFRSFLLVMFRPHYDPSPEEATDRTLDEWIAVLKLSTMWCFDGLRRVAISNLQPLLQASQDLAVRWVVLARLYDVHDWLKPALCALGNRGKPIQLDEVEALGIATVVKMAEVRDHKTYVANQYRWSTDTQVCRVFEEELAKPVPA